MITLTSGDILRSDAEAFVNTVNCVGIMGRGIALQFKQAFPDNFKAYKTACDRNEVRPGKMFVFTNSRMTAPKYIVNFPTKRHWRGKSRIEDIEAGLRDLVEVIERLGVRSIAIPPLGSGLGGLDWSMVRERIVEALQGLESVEILLFEPGGQPSKVASAPAIPKMTPGRAALVVLIYRYLGGLLDPFITLLEVHKLMYFMQEAGQHLRLKYAKAPYGPYAENLRHVLHQIEGHMLSGYSDGGDDPAKRIELVPGAYEEAQAFLRDDSQTAANFDRVGRLVEGFETPFGLELLATVHWVMTREGAASADEAMQLVYAWNKRKKRFTERQITLAFDVLNGPTWAGRALVS